MKKLCVFCGSREGNNKKYMELACKMGKMLAQNKIELVYGGGGFGLMGKMADAVIENGGNIYGIIPDFMMEWEVAHQGLTDLKIVSTMHERKKKMYDLSDGFMALPGGMGTMDEFCEIVTWAQIQHHSRPCWILNYEGFYDYLLKHFLKIKEEGFLSEAHYKLIRQVHTVEEAMVDINKMLKIKRKL